MSRDASAKHTAAATDLAASLAALPEMATVDLRAEWRRLYRSQAPRRIRRDLLVLAIAWKLQERVYGGLTSAQKRKLAAITVELGKNGDVSESAAIRAKPGSRLVREWRGETHTILVLEDGFEWNGKHRGSLSAIAREITGAHWSGPRFFGLHQSPIPFAGKEWAEG